MKKIYVECTYVFDHPQMHSGIQRVVKKIIQNLPDNQSENFQAVPVIIERNQVFRVKKMPASRGFEKKVGRGRAFLEGVRNHYWLYLGRFEVFPPFNKSLTMRRILFIAFKLGSLGYWLPLQLLNWIDKRIIRSPLVEKIQPEAGDVLLLLDSSWHGDFFEYVLLLKARNIQIISVIYDLIPVTHPQFCDEHLVKVFNGWLDWTVENADGYLAISKTIAAEFSEILEARLSAEDKKSRWVDSFYLGADFYEASSSEPRARVKSVFSAKRHIYLTVSTIEPRKNHTYILDAFELLWADGVDVSLCIVGKVGWKTESLIQRIRSHAELNKRLFMFNDLSDDELDYCYHNSQALIFASHVEGFGLPLVEAAQRALPVLCSDIPVFREVGGDFCHYFDLSDFSSLKDIVLEFDNNQLLAGGDVTQHVKWNSWLQCTSLLLKAVETNAFKP